MKIYFICIDVFCFLFMMGNLCLVRLCTRKRNWCCRISMTWYERIIFIPFLFVKCALKGFFLFVIFNKKKETQNLCSLKFYVYPCSWKFLQLMNSKVSSIKDEKEARRNGKYCRKVPQSSCKGWNDCTKNITRCNCTHKLVT